MLFKVLKYDVLRDGTRCRREVPAAPEMAAPVPFADGGKFPLDLVGRSALHLADQIADGQFRRHRHEHVDVIARQHALDDLDAILSTDLPDDLPDTQP